MAKHLSMKCHGVCIFLQMVQLIKWKGGKEGGEGEGNVAKSHQLMKIWGHVGIHQRSFQLLGRFESFKNKN